MDWQKWRSEFPILSRKTYLNSCSLGALSHRAEARVREFHEDWHNYGASAWYETWMGRLAELRTRVARMLNAPYGSIALAHSTSSALATLASSVDYTKRNRVVVADLDFPTLAYQWLVRPDVEVVYAASDDNATVDPQRFAQLVNDKTAILATSHVFYATGAIQRLQQLADIAHRNGALFLVDGYHGAGQVPVDLSSVDVDIYLTGPLKWLLGGPGLCYIYVKPDLIEKLTPRTAGWFGAREQFAFDIHHFDFKDDARRFEMGTPALHMVHSALGGQEIIDEVTVPAIRQRNQHLAELAIELAQEAGFKVRCAPQKEDRSAIVMIGVANPHSAVDQLASRGIIVDARPGHVRVSPHFYNLEPEIELVIDELRTWRDRA